MAQINTCAGPLLVNVSMLAKGLLEYEQLTGEEIVGLLKGHRSSDRLRLDAKLYRAWVGVCAGPLRSSIRNGSLSAEWSRRRP
jgi:hypothetical protein